MREERRDDDEGVGDVEEGGLAYAGGRRFGPNMMCGGKRSRGGEVGTAFWY